MMCTCMAMTVYVCVSEYESMCVGEREKCVCTSICV